MFTKFVPPDLLNSPVQFLRPDGLSLSVWLLMQHIWWDVSALSETKSFSLPQFSWLSNEVRSYMLWHWGSKKDLDEIARGQLTYQKGWPKEAGELLWILIEKMKWMGEYNYANIVSFDTGTPEDHEGGNNRSHQSACLQKCILLGIRLGMDTSILEEWKSKLKPDALTALEKNIFPIQK
jgi:hypothetical protein